MRDISAPLAAATDSFGASSDPGTEYHLAIVAAVHLDAGPIRVWSGVGDLVAEGHTYKGIGDLGGFADVREGRNAFTSQSALVLSGMIYDESGSNAEEIPGFRDSLGAALGVNVIGKPVGIGLIAFGADFAQIGQIAWFLSHIGDGLEVSESVDAPGLVVKTADETVNFDRMRRATYSQADNPHRDDGDLFFAFSAPRQRNEWGQKENRE